MTQWLKTNQECPQCGSSRGLGVAIDHEHCFRCGYHLNSSQNSLNLSRNDMPKRIIWTGDLPSDFQYGNISDEHRAYLSQFDFDWAKVCGSSEMYDRLIFPIYHSGVLKCYQGRSLHKEPKWRTISPKYEWGYKYPLLVHNNDSKSWVIVEDIISAWVVSNVENVIGLLGSSVNDKLCNFILSQGNEFIIWLDNDDAGKKGTAQLLHKLNMSAKLRIVRSKYDPKYYSRQRVLDNLIR